VGHYFLVPGAENIILALGRSMAARYILDRTPEIERLEQQAALIGHDRVRDHLDVADGQSVLDAGCGSGWVSRLIARETPGAKVTGIDITPGFVDYAKLSAKQEGLVNLDYTVGDICALPFDDGSFDVVWSQLVVFFLPQPEKAVAEFARVVRPGGMVKVIVTDGVFEQLWPERKELSNGIRAVRDKALHGWRFPRLPYMLEAAGLKDITVDAAVDRVYSFVGGASPEQRHNIEESYVHAIKNQDHLPGGEAEADRLAAELMDFIDDRESVSFSTHWTVSGTKPS
jgi:ubiquinone/menaquinone biosynthesis C-methylase UbiE